MILTIDIGNTNITFGNFKRSSAEVVSYANFTTDRTLTTDDIAVKYLNLLELWGLKNVSLDNVIISSVVPTLEYPFKHMFEKYFKVSPFFVDKQYIPIKINYDFPDEIGADRIVNSYAGIKQYPNENLIIVDFGTATTYDVVSGDGTYEGGIIVPGIITSLRSLEDKAAKLPHIDLSGKSAIVGKNTVAGIRSGILQGNGAMLDGLVERIAEEMGWDSYKVISTGGLSELIKHTSRSIDSIDKHLTLKGLFYIWKLNNE